MFVNSTLDPAAFFMPIGQMQTHFSGPRYQEEHADNILNRLCDKSDTPFKLFRPI
jgi:hypothetical protein